MARTINHIERISDSFDALAPEDQRDIVAELFTRLSPIGANIAMRVMTCWHNTQTAQLGARCHPGGSS